MKRMKFSALFILLVITAVMASCGPTEPAPDQDDNPGPKAWFDAPLPSSVFVPPNPINLVMHASDAEGIASFELSANGAVVAEIPSPNTSDSIITLTYDWHPPEPGRYMMTVRAQSNSGNWGPYAETVVIYAADIPKAVLPTGSPTGTATPTHPVPPQPPTDTPQRAVITFERINPNLIYFRGNDCGPKGVNVQVRAIEPAGIKVVVLFYQIESKGGNGASGFDSVAMNPVGDDLYQANINPESIYGAAALSKYGESWLDLQAVIQNSKDDTSTRTIVHSDTTVAPCGGAPPPPPTATLSRRVLPTPTNTRTVVR